MTSLASCLAAAGATSGLDWLIAGSIGVVAVVVSVYRVTTRRMGWGPRET